MAKPRLKVYRAQMGFAEAIVAAPSQKAALQAWGARQNLFAEGLATVAEDAEEVGAATAKPGVVLQRPVGSKSGFSEELVGRPEPPPGKPAAAGSKTPPKAAKPPPERDRSALTAAEKALASLEEEATTRLDDLARRREQLDAEELRLRRELDARRGAARRKLEQARCAYESA